MQLSKIGMLEYVFFGIVFIGITVFAVVIIIPVWKQMLFKRQQNKVVSEAKPAVTNSPNIKKDSGNQVGINIQKIVDKFSLQSLLSSQEFSNKVIQAGYRSNNALAIFLFAMLVLPIVSVALTAYYILTKNGHLFATKNIIFLGIAGVLGFYMPKMFIEHKVKERQAELQKAWPDAMDLLLIGIEAGISFEVALRRVTQEIGDQSIALAEELSITLAELSFMNDRSRVYEHLGTRTGVDSIRRAALALGQAEKYGTPISQALRIITQEGREERIAHAEQKAAALAPKLTVPLVLFFLPALFLLILGPVAIQVTS